MTPAPSERRPREPGIESHSGRRRFAALAVIAWLAVLFALGQGNIEVDVAPLCSITVEGLRGGIRPELPDPLAHADVLVDSLTAADHRFALPANPPSEKRLALRPPILLSNPRVAVLGSDDQKPCRLAVAFEAADSQKHPDGRSRGPAPATTIWQAADGVPPYFEAQANGTFGSVSLELSGGAPATLNNISVYASAPLWLAALYWLTLTIAAPWTMGMIWLAAVFGVGRILDELRSRIGRLDSGDRADFALPPMARRLILGLTGAASLSLCGRGAGQDATAIGFTSAAIAFFAGLEAAALWRSRTTAQWDDERRCMGSMMRLSLLLVCVVAVDTHFLRGNRVVPYDHLMPLFGSQRIAAGVVMNEDLAARPWLTHLLAVPPTLVSGRFAYPAYLGFMAALNSTAIVAVHSLACRQRLPAPGRLAECFAGMPVAVCLHFFGQRPASAALSLLAIICWTAPGNRKTLGLAATAAALAIGMHPGALFVLPGAFCWILFTRFCRRANGSPPGVVAPLCSLAVPIAAYLLWTAAIANAFPQFRNNLVRYPILESLESAATLRGSFLDAVLGITADQWSSLAANRLGQIPQYLFAIGPRAGPAEWLRPISLPNCLGVLGTLLLLSPRTWKWEPGLLFCGIAAPLAVHHLFIGQAPAQFHISPTPFVLLACLSAARLLDETGDRHSAFSAVFRIAVVSEWCLRIAFPFLLLTAVAWGLAASTAGTLGVFRGDVRATLLSASVLGVIACWCAARSYQSTRTAFTW